MLAMTFGLLVGVFGLVASMFLVPAVTGRLQGLQLLVPFAAFSVLGGILTFLTFCFMRPKF